MGSNVVSKKFLADVLGSKVCIQHWLPYHDEVLHSETMTGFVNPCKPGAETSKVASCNHEPDLQPIRGSTESLPKSYFELWLKSWWQSLLPFVTPPIIGESFVNEESMNNWPSVGDCFNLMDLISNVTHGKGCRIKGVNGEKTNAGCSSL